ncbi:ATP-binding protein [Fulvivirgaceae bacterium BMA10]|uniref:ATP-binding protein n=1 Tax=Splendidivirga corallicola TaxID=3051826 RepID=A0ABT8KUS9_9BACT|nr:ATP-binding protein [Fulvivirgaceae bacterium BMA10]
METNENSNPVNPVDELVMEFDPNTIEHLGINQYSTLPPVIAELVSNSYDADANSVIIYLNDDDKKEIRIEDDGHGMTFKQLNDRFLRIGRNRRSDDDSQKSESGKRLVIGKKGIGKLSFFGIAEVIEVETYRNHIRNVFQMNLSDLKAAGKERKKYKPTILVKDEQSDKEKGTTILLSSIKRKSAFYPEDIAYSLSRYFSVFDEPDFDVKIIHNNENNDRILVKNKLKFKAITEEFSWNFPLPEHPREYLYSSEIKGEIISALDTVPNKMEGIALFSRGKLVNEHSFFDVKASSHGYKYITGWLDVSFIDEWDKEVISTNRRSLNWEDDDTVELKEYLNAIIYAVYNEQRKKKVKKKKEEIKSITGLDIDAWVLELPRHEQKLANSIINTIVKSESIETKKAGELVKYVQESFEFESFKEFAADLETVENIESEHLIRLFKEWKLIEAREFYKLAKIRVETIKKFEYYIDTNAKEIPTLHNFLKHFPWLLDPRIMNFKDEVTYSKLLREHFKEDDIPVENKRIDFLCVDFSETIFIIELKRPKTPIGKKQLLQGTEYVSFLKSKLGNEFKKNVYCYVIGERFVKKEEITILAEGLKTQGIYLKTYTELLSSANKYHQEFIDRYDELDSIYQD